MKHAYVAVIVDALRASATAAMLLAAGALELTVVKEVDDAFKLRESQPDALLFGERGGLPPEGFDFGNSPRIVAAAANRNVIFTTTTGARRLVDSWNAAAVYMATTINATAAARIAVSHGTDVVLIPAGLATDPSFDAQEDWVASAAVAARLGLDLGEGAERCRAWQQRINAEGLHALFNSAPHSAKLRRIALDADIAFCAQMDITDAVPVVTAKTDNGVLVRKAASSALCNTTAERSKRNSAIS